MTDVLNPFTQEDFDQMEESIKSSEENEKAIKKAQAAGIELPGLLEDNRSNRDRMRQIITTYRPGLSRSS